MQPIHILGDHAADHSGLLQPRDRAMAFVRLRVANARPADRAARPVARASGRVAHELSVLHRLASALSGGRAAIVRNSGFRAETGAGEDDDAAAAQEVLEGVEADRWRSSIQGRYVSGQPCLTQDTSTMIA